MNIRRTLVLGATAALVLGAVSVATPQIREAIRIVGVGAAVQRFGPEINRAINNLSNHKDDQRVATKVVPILSVGIGRSSAIGAAQVMGPPERVRQVKAVAAPEAELFGREIRIRAMIPIATEDVANIRRVDGVGISGIVDLKL